MFTFSDYKASADYIRAKIGDFQPKYLLILGSGLGFLADRVDAVCKISYSDIPNFRSSTAPGHEGKLVAGKLSGKDVLVMQGRVHFYEGCELDEIAFPVRVSKLLGAESLIVTNAAGGINMNYSVGDLMIIRDFVNLSFRTPLRGENIPEFGPRFCDMSKVFAQDYRTLAKKIAQDNNIKIQEGVYFFYSGPQFETPSEIIAFRGLGADAVGMSTVPECIAARHCGMKTLGITLITNMACGILDTPLSEEEVMTEAAKARPYFSKLVLEFIKEVDTDA